MKIVATPTDLRDLAAFQRLHGAVVTESEPLRGGNTRVTLQAVASLDFHIRVWNGHAYLVRITSGGGEIVSTPPLDAWTFLQSAVVEIDNGATLRQSGNYYALSESSLRCYRALLAALESNI